MYKSVFIVLVLILSACGGSDSKKNCDAFATQSEAQEYFRSHNASNLDRDNDGIACESLPKNSPTTQLRPLNQLIGTYTLLGENCETEICTPQSVTLNIESNSSISICMTAHILDGCDVSQGSTFDMQVQQNSYLFDEGKLEFGTNEYGHLSMKYKSYYYYGQNVLSTDTYESGMYSQEGILINDESLVLSSKFGQSIIWNEENGITVNND
jgi:hypothetical protein